MAVTPNLGLHQWQSGDSFLRTDFNSDFSRIDTAVGKKAEVMCGSYVGSAPGALISNSANSQTISLGFTPKAVLVLCQHSSTYSDSASPEVALATAERPFMGGGYAILGIVPGGFSVGSVKSGADLYRPLMNSSGTTYDYLAVK